MAWISRSLTGILKDGDDKEEKEPEFWDDPELFDPAQSVRDDLAELRKSLTQSLWGVASFLAPPPAPAPSPRDGGEGQDVEHTVSDSKVGIEAGGGVSSVNEEDAKESEEEVVVDDAPKVMEMEAVEETTGSSEKEKERMSRMQSDLAELKGGFAKGLSRLSSVIRGDDSRSGDKLEKSSQDHGIAGLLKPLIDNVLSPDKPVASSGDEEEQGGGMEVSRMGISPATLVDGVSKLASSLFSFDEADDDEDDARVPGLTDDVVAFARNIALHPETWLDFPLSPDDDQHNAFEMNSYQIDHAYAVERAALRLAALKVEITPRHMSEARFWRIYFVLLHPRLSQEDAALLSTPQVLESRKLLLEQLRQGKDEEIETATTAPAAAASTAAAVTAIKSDDTLVVDKDAIPSTVKLLAATRSCEEAEADEWLHEEATTSSVAAREDGGPAANEDQEEDDVSFSDLEEEQDDGKIQQAAKAQGWVELGGGKAGDAGGVKKHERMGSNDWLTVDKEDA